MQMKQAELEQQNLLNERDNETKIVVASMSHGENTEAQDKLNESIRQFNERLALDKDKLALDKKKAADDTRLKEKALNKKPTSSN
jgi:hypothetical protein